MTSGHSWRGGLTKLALLGGKWEAVDLRVIRASFLSVVIWVLVVAFGSTTAWVAIDRVGEGLVLADSPTATDDSSNDADPADPILPTSSASAPVSDPSVVPSDSGQPGPDPSMSKATQPTDSPGSSTSATAPPKVGPSETKPGGSVTSPSISGGSTTPEVPTDKGGGTTTVPPTSVKRMVQGAAGLISSVCEGSTPRVRYASPQDGWALDDYRRPTTVAVAFHREDHLKRGFIIFVGCVRGTPTFVTTERGVSIAFEDIRVVLNNRSFLEIASALHWAVAFPNGTSR